MVESMVRGADRIGKSRGRGSTTRVLRVTQAQAAEGSAVRYDVHAFAPHDHEFPVNTWRSAKMADVLSILARLFTNDMADIDRVQVDIKDDGAGE
jgi:hypothetical protein